ncbi:MAG: hypothetical protein K9N49_05125 [Candidatus Marinimicrobia bacterium]|nr:hypothetical protein [Candidatus Neomarinimicrobiota bacterium]
MLETSAMVERHDLRFAYHGPKKDERPVLLRNAPHEAGVGGWGTVLRENDAFRMWHRVAPAAVDGEWVDESSIIGYAESADGVRWERPDIGLVEHGGDCKNNYTDLPFSSGSVMPDVTGEHRYLAVGMVIRESVPEERWPWPDLRSGYYGAHSEDGLHWTLHPEPIALTRCDVCSGAYDEIEQRYVFIPKLNTRFGGLMLRSMCWADTRLFGEWGPIRPILTPDEGDFLEARRHGAVGMDFQYMTILPYRDVTLGFVSCFYLDPSYVPSGACTHGRNNVQLAWQEKRIRQGGPHPLYPDRHEYQSRVDNASPYGAAWRFLPSRPAFIPWGEERGTESDVYPGSLVEVDDEMWMYYTATTAWHGETQVRGTYAYADGTAGVKQERGTSWVGRAVMKRDRFVSLWANVRGMVELRHGPRDGQRLLVNARCPRGFVKAEIVDQNTYKPVPGFEKQNCIAFNGDSVRGELVWKDRPIADIPEDTDLTLRFYIETGDLFAYEFDEPGT